MKMKANTKIFLFITALAVMLASCNGDYDGFLDVTENSNSDVTWAKEYYEQQSTRSTRLGVQKGKSNGVAVRPGWKHIIKEQGTWYSFVETDLVTDEVFNYVLPENGVKFQETGDGRYLISQTRFVFRKSPVKEEMFYMTIIPSAGYLEKTKFEPFKKMSYMKRDKSFSGIILFHDQNGEFANGWKYKDGIVTDAILKIDENQRFTRKLNSDEDTIKMLMSDGYIMYYSEGGGYSYTMTTLGDDVVDFEVKTTKSYDIPYYSTSVDDSYGSNYDYGSMEDERCSSNYESSTSGYSYAPGGYAANGGSNYTKTNGPVDSVELKKKLALIEEIKGNGKFIDVSKMLRQKVCQEKGQKEDGRIVLLKDNKTILPSGTSKTSVNFPTISKGVKIALSIHAHPQLGGITPSPADWRKIRSYCNQNNIDPAHFIYCVTSKTGDFIVTINDITKATQFITKVFGSSNNDQQFEIDFGDYHRTDGKPFLPSYINYIIERYYTGGNVPDFGLNIIWHELDTDTDTDTWEIVK